MENNTIIITAIDFSGSMQGAPIQNVMKKLIETLQTLKKNCKGKFESSAITFQERTIREWTTPQILYFAWKQGEIQCGGSTPLHDAILTGLDKIMKSPATNKIFIMGTDGQNNSSKVRDPDVVKAKMIEFIEKYDGLPIYLCEGLAAWTNANTLGLSVNTCLATNFSSKQDTAGASQAVTEVCTQYMNAPTQRNAFRASTLPCFTSEHRESSQTID